MVLCFSGGMQVFWAIALELSGRFYSQSKQTLGSWRNLAFKSAADKKFMSKFKRGCYPMALGERGVFGIKQISVLKFLRAIIKGTFRALLTLGGKKHH